MFSGVQDKPEMGARGQDKHMHVGHVNIFFFLIPESMENQRLWHLPIWEIMEDCPQESAYRDGEKQMHLRTFG